MLEVDTGIDHRHVDIDPKIVGAVDIKVGVGIREDAPYPHWHALLERVHLQDRLDVGNSGVLAERRQASFRNISGEAEECGTVGVVGLEPQAPREVRRLGPVRRCLAGCKRRIEYDDVFAFDDLGSERSVYILFTFRTTRRHEQEQQNRQIDLPPFDHESPILQGFSNRSPLLESCWTYRYRQ